MTTATNLRTAYEAAIAHAMTLPTARIYSACGAVRGDCGHQHATYEEASACAHDDHVACSALPGGNSYSDRTVAWTDSPREEALARALRDWQTAAWKIARDAGPADTRRAIARRARRLCPAVL